MLDSHISAPLIMCCVNALMYLIKTSISIWRTLKLICNLVVVLSFQIYLSQQANMVSLNFLNVNGFKHIMYAVF